MDLSIPPLKPAVFRYDLAKALFWLHFRPGIFYTTDCRNTFGGYVHTAFLTIEPLRTIEETREKAVERFGDLCLWARRLRWLFGRGDRIQFIVGISEGIRGGPRQIIKGWLPAKRLRDFNAAFDVFDLAAIGGGSGEVLSWLQLFE